MAKRGPQALFAWIMKEFIREANKLLRDIGKSISKAAKDVEAEAGRVGKRVKKVFGG